MYICKKCGKVFKEEDVVEIHDDPSPAGVSLPSGYYTYYECPYCGSDDIHEATECVVCGDYFVDDGDDVCEECFGTIENKLLTIRLECGLSDEQFARIVRQIY